MALKIHRSKKLDEDNPKWVELAEYFCWKHEIFALFSNDEHEIGCGCDWFGGDCKKCTDPIALAYEHMGAHLQEMSCRHPDNIGCRSGDYDLRADLARVNGEVTLVQPDEEDTYVIKGKPREVIKKIFAPLENKRFQAWKKQKAKKYKNPPEKSSIVKPIFSGNLDDLDVEKYLKKKNQTELLEFLKKIGHELHITSDGCGEGRQIGPALFSDDEYDINIFISIQNY